jgi:hypothetical protein
LARDPLKSYKLPNRATPMKSGVGRRKSKETPQEFVDRLVEKRPRCPEPFPVVILAVEGDLSLAALFYEVDEQFLKDLCAWSKPCGEAWTRARAVRIAAEKESRESADALKKAALDEVARLPDLPVRSNWPVDDVERVRAQRAWLLEKRVLRHYHGDLVRISEGGTIPLDVLVEMVKTDEVLRHERDIGYAIAAEIATSRMMAISKTSNQPTAALKIIQALGDDDRWHDRSKVEVKSVGFEVPDSGDDELVSVLRRVK